MNVTEHFAELSVQEPALLKEPVEFDANVTVPVGDEPVTETETVVGIPTLTDDGKSVRVVVVDTLFTVSVDWPELAALVASPP
ncbi:protein of unknown function [Candidatus Nitrosotalea okcheonensis]|uniref:Uncharacterized protein n=1 Tax=Candidatus Nitrosotalea okcheonensis TaxID=1903276 RepID=A0A2H1FHA8_9ARCH|nr:protein of unknown function [Candidatus Nitrosotalea okcheonensis]SMH72156.1 protein of unknown function [Candidatus Nitrosotalea okcheonensis]